MSMVGAIFSVLRGHRFVHEESSLVSHVGDVATTSGAVPGEMALEADSFS